MQRNALQRYREAHRQRPDTVSKEVKNHSKEHKSGFSTVEGVCPLLMKAPFVCNGCDKKSRSTCMYTRRLYNGRVAQSEYKTTLKTSREGIPLNKEEFYTTEGIIVSAVKSGQNVYHAITANNLDVSKSSVYRYIDAGYYRLSKVDLPRAAKFKPRKQKKGEYVPKGVKSGRSFEDFLLFTEENPRINCVEMDTVIGRIGGKVIMTFQFVNVDFMFGLLLDNKTAAGAASKVIELKKRLADAGLDFGYYFPILLTDNGGEFSNVTAFENIKRIFGITEI